MTFVDGAGIDRQLKFLKEFFLVFEEIVSTCGRPSWRSVLLPVGFPHEGGVEEGFVGGDISVGFPQVLEEDSNAGSCSCAAVVGVQITD